MKLKLFAFAKKNRKELSDENNRTMSEEEWKFVGEVMEKMFAIE
jgi:hypothetical protein